MVENGEIRSGQAVAVGAKTFVHAMQIEQHDIRLRLFSQERHYFQQLVRFNPYHGHAGTGGLNSKGFRPKTVAQFADHRVVKVIRVCQAGKASCVVKSVIIFSPH